MAVKKRMRSKENTFFDYNLLAVVIILMCFGLVMLYSASSYEAANKLGNDLYYFLRQFVIGFAAILIALVVSRFDYHIFIKASPVLYVISLLLMVMVRWSPLGIEAGGARRWLGYGPFSFQPSEIAKIAVMLLIAQQILRLGREFYTWAGALRIIAIGVLAGGCAFYFTDNLSTAVIIALIGLFMTFIAYPKTRPFIIFFICVAIIIAVGVLVVANTVQTSENFRMRRILTWLDPEGNSSSGGWQVLQGLYAIGSGGLFGKGLGNSTQKLDTIPEAQNDMIFSIICEELGLFGAIIVLLLFAYLLYRLFCIAVNAADLEGCLLVSGIFLHISLQVILNICVVLNVIPTTGVTLPFVSYGGTSILFLLIEIGLALGVSRQIKEKANMSALSRRVELPKRKVVVDKHRHS